MPFNQITSGLGSAYDYLSGKISPAPQIDPNTGAPYLNTGTATAVTGADASTSGGTMDAETAAQMGYVQNPYGPGYVDPSTLQEQGAL